MSDNRTRESRSQTQVVDAGSVERRKDDEKQQAESNCEGVRKQDIRPPVAASQILVDLLPPAPFRCALKLGRGFGYCG